MKGIKLPEILHTDLLNKKQGEKKKLLKKQRGIFGFISLFVMFSIAFMPRPVHAAWWDSWIKAIFEWWASIWVGMLNLIVLVVTMVINLLLTIFAWFAKLILDFSISLSLNTNYTSGAVFDGGWPVLRDIANMGLILVLVAIGIGTMLNLKTNKKQLVTFFIIALLINFTPVITGVIIDFSNIIASILYASAQNASSAFIGANPFSSVTNDFGSIIGLRTEAFNGSFSLADFAPSIKAIVSIFLNIIIIFMFLFLAALFLARTLVLQVLVILSPLAFVLYISPSTRKHFNRWWKAFLQWSIIIIPMIFSLWLAGAFLNGADEYCSTAELGETSGDLETALGGIASNENVCEMTAMMLAVGALLMGISLSFSSSAEGSKIIMKQAKNTNKYLRKRAPAYGAGFSKTRAGQFTGRQAKRVGQGALKYSGLGFAGRQLSRVPGVRKGAQALVAPVRGKIKGEVEKARNEWKKIKGPGEGYGKYSPEALDGALEYETRPSHVAKIHDTFAKQHPEEYAKSIDEGRISESDIEDLKKIARFHVDAAKEVLKIVPELSDNIKETIEKMSFKELTKVAKKSLENPEVVKAIIESDKQTRDLMRELGKNPEKMRAYNVGLGRLAAQELGTTKLARGGGAIMPNKKEVRRWLEKKKEEGTITKFESEIQNLPYFEMNYEYARQETQKEKDARIKRAAREEMEDEGYTNKKDKDEDRENKKENE